MVKTIYVALLVMVFCTPFAVADDRRTEVRQQVTERCATATVHYRVWQYRQVGRIVPRSAIRMMIEEWESSEASMQLEESLYQLTRGKNELTRQWIYDTAFVNCFVRGVGD